jgi:hypothetical protein
MVIMEQTQSRKKRPQLQDAGVALLSVTALLLTVLLVRHAALGVTFSVGIISVYSLLRQGDIRTASVSIVLWAVFATTVYTSVIPVVLFVGGFCLVSYITWKKYGSH